MKYSQKKISRKMWNRFVDRFKESVFHFTYSSIIFWCHMKTCMQRRYPCMIPVFIKELLFKMLIGCNLNFTSTRVILLLLFVLGILNSLKFKYG